MAAIFVINWDDVPDDWLLEVMDLYWPGWRDNPPELIQIGPTDI